MSRDALKRFCRQLLVGEADLAEPFATAKPPVKLALGLPPTLLGALATRQLGPQGR